MKIEPLKNASPELESTYAAVAGGAGTRENCLILLNGIRDLDSRLTEAKEDNRELIKALESIQKP